MLRAGIADVQPAAVQAGLDELAVQPRLSECIAVLVVREERQAVRFGERADAVARRHHIVEVEDRHVAVAPAHAHARHFEVGLVDEERVNEAVLPLRGTQPRLYDDDAARTEMARERLQRLIEAPNVGHIADRAEEGDDRIEALSQIESHHVAQMEGHVGIAVASDVEHRSFDVQSLAREIGSEVFDVPPRTAAGVEQCVAARTAALLDDIPYLRGFLLVVFAHRAVQGVVVFGGLRIHVARFIFAEAGNACARPRKASTCCNWSAVSTCSSWAAEMPDARRPLRQRATARARCSSNGMASWAERRPLRWLARG